ncbi:MAG: ATP synthase F0 subunit B [Alphaproteobacteria bacterium]|nr:ATP synthase F0 subunit B [Alphaproteobacteria bacterium]
MDEALINEISETSTVVPSGQDIIDATQNAIIDAAENVSEAIVATGKTAATELPAEPFYLEIHFWIGVAFVLAILCIIKPIYKFVKAALLRRIDKVVSDIANATQLRDDAQALLADYERKFVNAQDEAQKLIEKSRKNMQNIKKRELATLKTELQNKEKEAERRIAAATEKTKAEINLFAGRASIDLAQKVINRYLQITDKSKLIDDAIAELDKLA